MLTEHQYAYLAGIIDGEGHVSIDRLIRKDDKKRLRNYCYRPSVRVAQARIKLLETIQSWVGAENASISKTGRESAYWCLRFKAHWLREHLPRIAKYMILKGSHAEIFMWFLEHQNTGIGRHGAGDAVWKERDEMYAKMRILNAYPSLAPVKVKTQ